MPQLNSRELLERARQAQSPVAPVYAAEPRQNELSAEALLIAGRAEYQQRHLDRAAEFLALAARANPDSVETQHLLGNVEQDLGRLDSAIACYQRALRLEPQRSAAENDLGTALFAKGLHREAADAFRRCVALDPSNHRAYENLGSALRKLGNFPLARNAFQRAFWIRLAAPLRRLFGIRQKPLARGTRLEKNMHEAYLAGRYEEADRLSDECLRTNPIDRLALQIRAHSLNRRGEYAQARPILEELIRRSPDSFDLHDALGTCLGGLQHFDPALLSFNRALALNPKSAIVHSNVSSLMYDKAKYVQAEAAARTALEIEPRSVPAMVNLGAALLALGRDEEAETEFRRALSGEPHLLRARLHLCGTLFSLGRLDEFRRELERVREIKPDNTDRHLHLGILAQEVEHDFPAALEHFRAAQRLAPQHPAPYLNEALLRLANGDFAHAVWDLYERRKEMSDRAPALRRIGLPAWDGSRLEPRALLVYGEQGLGDEIMLASMLPEALALAPGLRLAAHPRLQTLFARSFREADVIGWDGQEGPPDPGSAKYAIAVGSLGRFFRLSARDFPQHAGYLAPDPEKVAAMRAKLDALGPGRKIGISWRGGVPLTRSARRTLDLARLTPILRRPGCHWINLQYGNVDDEISEVAKSAGVRVEQLHDASNDFEDAAALMSAFDLTLSVCSTTVHLCGALGRPVWVMAPYTAEWRYGMSGPRMLWYPSAEVFRQPSPGDWDSVIAQIGARLDAL